MRVLFLTLYPDSAASPRYRVAQFLPYLRAHGVECTVAPAVDARVWQRFTGPDRTERAFWYHAHELPRRVAQLAGARPYDIVFLQKAIMSAYVRGMPTLLRVNARRIIYDIDDAVHLTPPHPLRGPWRALEDRAQVAAIMRMASLTLAGNSWLCRETERLGGRAALFPTVVDTNRWHPAAAPATAYRLGWIGSPSTTPTLDAIAPLLARLPEAEVVLVGADAQRVHCPGAVVAPWTHDTEVAMVQQFAVGLMPQTEDEWTRGKCALKALLYMACGVPCVATPHGAACDLIEDGVNGFLAGTPEAWRTALESLRDPALRARMGEAARETVTARFALNVAEPQLLAHLKGLA